MLHGLLAATSVTGFDPAAATEAYIATMDAAARSRSDAYFEGGYWLILVNLVAGLIVAFLLLQTGFAKGLRDRIRGVVKSTSLTVAIYAAIYTVVTTLLLFPLTIWQGYFREHAYGLSTMTMGGWMSEQLIGLVTGMVMAAIFLTLFYLVLRIAKRTWWIWGAAVSVVLLAVTIFVSPVYIDPLFNEYTPMEESVLRDDILALAQANGIPADNVYVFDVSRQSNRITANVNGLFGTTRIALSDTLIENTDPDEVLAVMGHEMGHYALNHLWEMFTVFAILLAIGFAFTDALFRTLNDRFGGRWGVSGISDIAGLPLLAACLSVFFFLMTPVANTIIRTNEAEADLFGLNAARAPDGFATAALRLAAYRKIDPGPLEEFVFFDHPSGRARVAMSMQWKAGQLAWGATDQTSELRLDRAEQIMRDLAAQSAAN
ncbi:M48 family metallopeptidase [Hyphobacterium sp.]|uniref:M48 family metallopeptidase n=1 Tax=Hyphobacterium sp. TaxID=2004662 RepID=UPI003B52ED56